jgi:hypothetical protein
MLLAFEQSSGLSGPKAGGGEIVLLVRGVAKAWIIQLTARADRHRCQGLGVSLIQPTVLLALAKTKFLEST